MIREYEVGSPKRRWKLRMHICEVGMQIPITEEMIERCREEHTKREQKIIAKWRTGDSDIDDLRNLYSLISECCARVMLFRPWDDFRPNYDRADGYDIRLRMGIIVDVKTRECGRPRPYQRVLYPVSQFEDDYQRHGMYGQVLWAYIDQSMSVWEFLGSCSMEFIRTQFVNMKIPHPAYEVPLTSLKALREVLSERGIT